MSQRNYKTHAKTVRSNSVPKAMAMEGRNIDRPPQIELFSSPEYNPDGYAQGLELVSCIPWFEPVRKALTISGPANPSDLRRTRLCTVNRQKVELEVTAATLTKCYRFPGTREELILDALLKIASEGTNGMFIDNASAVAFSLSQVQRVMTQHNNGKIRFNLTDIKEALLVLNSALFDIRLFFDDGDCESYKDTLISGLGVLSRNDWLNTDDKDVTCYARFHPMVTQAILNLRTRPYSLNHNVQFRSPAARRIYKNLAMFYRQASPLNLYSISLSTALDLTGYQDNPREKVFSKARKVENGLQELIQNDILTSYDISSLYGTGNRGRRAETDRVYTLHPHADFCRSIKKSNAIASEMRAKMSLIDCFRDEEIREIEHMDDFDKRSLSKKITNRVKSMDGAHVKRILQRRIDDGTGDSDDVVNEGE